jgi:hypothetical protein
MLHAYSWYLVTSVSALSDASRLAAGLNATVPLVAVSDRS